MYLLGTKLDSFTELPEPCSGDTELRLRWRVKLKTVVSIQAI